MNSLEAQEIFNRIRKVDWYYNYSDDYSVWKRGEASVKEIRNFANSREWSNDDINILKLTVSNTIKLDTRNLSDQQREDAIQEWNKRIDNLFKVKERNE